MLSGNLRRRLESVWRAEGEALVGKDSSGSVFQKFGIDLRAVWREAKLPAIVEGSFRGFGFDGGAGVHFFPGEIVWINQNGRPWFLLPNLPREFLHELKFTLVVTLGAVRAAADIVVTGLDHEAVRIRIKIEQHLTDVIEHELLRRRFARAQAPAPGVDAKRFDGAAVRFPGYELRMFESVLINAVISE